MTTFSRVAPSVGDTLGGASDAPAVASNGWRAGSVTAQIVRTLSTVGLLAIVARLAMAGRDVALAGRFGTNAAVDAFVVALVLPTFATQVISGSLPYSFVPTYNIAELERGPDAAARLLASTMMLNVCAVAGTGLLLAATAPLSLRAIGSGFDAHKVALTESLFFVLLPMYFFTAVSVVWGATLNVRGRFALPAVTPALAPLASCALLFASHGGHSIHAVAWGMTLGSAVEALVLAVAMNRAGMSPRPRWHGVDEHLREVLRQYAPAVGAALLMSSALVVDQAVAASQAPGSVASLNFGGKVVSFLLGVGTLAVGTVVLPHMSASAARHDWGEIRRTLRTYVKLVLATSIPVTLLVVGLSHWIVVTIFQHGAFTAHDAHVVTRVQMFYALQIPCFTLCIVAVRTLSALRRNQAFIGMAVGIVIVNLVTDIAFAHLWGVAGIALSTSLVYTLSCAVVFVLLHRVLAAEEART